MTFSFLRVIAEGPKPPHDSFHIAFRWKLRAKIRLGKYLFK
jgi:hypothetical protein